MSVRIVGALLTDTGRKRSVNEDWCGSLAPEPDQGSQPSASVWIVADGVSGFGTGRDASKLVVETVISACRDAARDDAESRLRAAIERANGELVRRGTDGSAGSVRRYASTVLAAIMLGYDLWLANVGDCRAYLLRGGTISQITRDHTWVAEQLARGQLRPDEAAGHPKRNVLTRWLGQRGSLQPDLFHYQLTPADRLVLCSDGLTAHVSDDEISQIAAAGDPGQVARQLIDLANRRGGTDNITVGVLEAVPVAASRPRPRRSPPLPSPTGETTDRLAALQAMSQRINGSLELGETLRSVMDSLVEITGAERGFVMLWDENEERLRFQIGRNVDARTVARDPELSRNIVEKVFRDQQPLLIGDAMSDPEFRAFESVIMQALRSVMCAPLVVKGKPIGVAYVDNSLNAELFRQPDLDMLAAFANMAASAIENARLHERLAEHVLELGAMKTTQERILRSVSSGIMAVDRQGTVSSCNRAASEMLAISPERAIGRKLSEILPPRFMLALGPPLAGEGLDPGSTIQGFEMEGELPGRGYVHLRHRLSPLRDEAGTTIGYVLVLDDLTERQRLERERREAAAEREQIRAVFENYMAPAVFQELMRQGPGGSGIAGARRELTILFADIRGFTGLSERSTPEEVVEILNGYLATATDVLFQHQGTIDKFIGDAIMALFGAPVPIDGHPLRAVRAALAMQRQFADTPSRGKERVSFGIGINTGAGIVGSIGAPKLKSYTVIGDVVNVAARLQSEARAGEVLISGDTYAQIAEDVVTEELGSIYVKGRLAPVNVYKVTDLRR
jgi:adenylate cyclase